DAGQRLGAGETLALEVDLGLVPHLAPAVGERLVDLDPRARVRGHGIDQRTPLILAELFDRAGPAPGLGRRIVGWHGECLALERHHLIGPTLNHWLCSRGFKYLITLVF